MKVTVKRVTDKTFDGNDGAKVAGVELEFMVDGQARVLQSYIPPVVAEVLKWNAGDDHEIEEYSDKNGKPKFKTPQAGGKGGGGFRGRSVAEQLELDAFHNERMDRRTALMQAVAYAPKDPPAEICAIADIFYEWLRENSEPLSGSTARGSDSGAVPLTSPRSAPTSSGSGEAHTKEEAPVQGSAAASLVGDPSSTPDSEPSEGGSDLTGEGGTGSPSANHTHKWAPVVREDMAKRGWEACSVCGKTERHAA